MAHYYIIHQFLIILVEKIIGIDTYIPTEIYKISQNLKIK